MVHGLTHEGAQGLVDAARGGMRQAQHAARALVDLYRQADDGLEIGHARQFAEQHGGRGAFQPFVDDGLVVAEDPAGDAAAHGQDQGLAVLQHQTSGFAFHAIALARDVHRGEGAVVEARGIDHGAHIVLDELRPAAVTEAQLLDHGQLGEVAGDVAGHLLPALAGLLAGDQLGKKLQQLVVPVSEGILPLAVHAQGAARGHGTAHECLDAGFLAFPVIAKLVLVLVEIWDQHLLAVADDPVYQAPRRKHGPLLHPFAKTEGGREIVLLAVFRGQEQDGGIGIENTADDAEDMFFKSIGSHVGTRLMVGPGHRPGTDARKCNKAAYRPQQLFARYRRPGGQKRRIPEGASGNSPQKQLFFTEESGKVAGCI